VGIRFAKLEQNIITAYFVAYFDFHMEDEHGNKVVNPPKPDPNQHGPEKPKVSHFIKVTPRD
jgi:sterol 14-demethylase